ncbi:formate dehydrogenase, subunit FdhD [Catenovulum agarivorans DS-2]|uniref:Formate dehydrogenase, subunit FdhD n=1 Tax=Catenovulum agarivorans DS-2 TaxID=1328313 RepID=W7QSA4_9ALTE|nr:formate dehydrogenase accessory sulfurtransferase FdhD [Catenovulum agarivorans]EWH10738.1 formate dehydrogenase, subunit FdhD [Catenovulum agarivorans DS-2]
MNQLITSKANQPRVLPDEAPIAITLNGLNYAVMMATPDDLDDFAYGFLFGENIITTVVDIHDIDCQPVCMHGSPAYELKITLANRAFAQLKNKQRQLVGSSGCGICGVKALEQVLKPQKQIIQKFPASAFPLTDIRSRINQLQRKNQLSGALHAAALLTDQGEIALIKEDIGRHNAVDKLFGAALKNPKGLDNCAMVITSRCGSELVLKAINYGIATLISFASPSQFAVNYAVKHGLVLVHVNKNGQLTYWDN